jgi:hypothetical protein
MFLRHQHSMPFGGLKSQLESFGLSDHLDLYKQLVELDWLRPAFHVPVPETWFHNWTNYPQQPAISDDAPSPWADHFEAEWLYHRMAPEVETDEWFVHPCLRRGTTRLDFFDHAVNVDDAFELTKIEHAPSRKFVPAFDYFYEWQLFRFADVVAYMRGTHPHFWRPGAHVRMAEYLTKTTPAEFERFAKIERWESRARAFTLIAHYIAFIGTFDQYSLSEQSKAEARGISEAERVYQELRRLKRNGATKLLTWLGVTAADIETALKDELLTLAQNWRWKKWDKTAKSLNLWRSLQQQIQATVNWLCLVNDTGPVTYLEKLRYQHLGQDDWAQLEDVLTYPLWRSAQTTSKYIVKMAKNYPAFRFSSLGGFIPSAAELVSLGSTNDAFDGYLDAIGRLIEDSTYEKDDDPFRARSRDSWYRVIAVLAEILFEELEKSKPDSKSVKRAIGGQNPAPLSIVAQRLAGKGNEFNKLKSGTKGQSHEVFCQICLLTCALRKTRTT